MEEENKDTIDNENEAQIYELGYHLLGNIGDEVVSEEVSKIHTLISKNGGTIVSEGAPLLLDLSYEISKRIETKNLRFNKAFFGWVKFELSSAKIDSVKKEIDSNQNVLRFLIIKTVKENTMHTPKTPVFKKDAVKADVGEEDVTEVVEKAPVSEAEIDKSIDELLVSEN